MITDQITDHIAARLRAVDVAPDPGTVRDVLWLASLLPDRLPAEPETPAEDVAPSPPSPVAVRRSPPVNHTVRTPDRPGAGVVEEVSVRRGRSRRVGRPAAQVVPPTLADPLGIGRALRPLRVRRPAPLRHELDESATAERAAQLPHWEPVLTDQLVRWPDLAIVVDCQPGIWRARLNRLELVLQRLGAFRQVRAWRLHERSRTGGEPVVAPGLTERQGPDRAARGLAEPTGRRLLLVVTDGTSDGWAGPYRRLLEHWAKTNPVGIISLVPARLWPHGGLTATRGRVRVDGPLQPNSRWNGVWRTGGRPPVPIPVADLRPSRLAQFATALAGNPQWTETLLLDVPRTRSTEEPPVVEEPVGAVATTRGILRPRAFALLVALGAGPILPGPLLNRARVLAVPDATDDDVAEVLQCGLLVPVAVPDADNHHEIVGYRFRDPHVRAELCLRLSPSLRSVIRWDLFLHAQSHLGLDRAWVRQVLDSPDDDVLLRNPCMDRPEYMRSFHDELVEERHRTGHALHLAVASVVGPRREAFVHELARRVNDRNRSSDWPVVVLTASSLLTHAADVLLDPDDDRILVIEQPELLRDRTDPRCRAVIRSLLSMIEARGQDGAPVLFAATRGRIDALFDEYPRFRTLMSVVDLPRTPGDDTYLILRGLLRGDGLIWKPETDRHLWHSVCDLDAAHPAGFDVRTMADQMYRGLVDRWRARTRADVTVAIEPEDLLPVPGKDMQS